MPERLSNVRNLDLHDVKTKRKINPVALIIIGFVVLITILYSALIIFSQ